MSRILWPGIFSQGQLDSPSPEPIQDSIDIRTGANTDVNHSPLSDSDLYNDNPFFPTYISLAAITGIRFPGVAIPVGATILNATLTVYQNENNTWVSGQDNRTLGMEQADNPVAPTNTTQRNSRYTNVGTTHTWVTSGFVSNNNPVTTGDITAMVQQIIDRGGWASGNSVMFWLTHPGGASANHQQRVHQGQAEGVRPRLQVDFEYIP